MRAFLFKCEIGLDGQWEGSHPDIEAEIICFLELKCFLGEALQSDDLAGTDIKQLGTQDQLLSK